MSLRVGAVLVAKMEDRPKDRMDGAQRVELASFHLVEQGAQLGVGADGGLEVAARTGRGDGEHLRGEVPPAALVEEPRVFEMGAVLSDRRPKLLHPFPGQ